MATYSYFRTLDITTTSTNYELMTNTDVKNAIIEHRGYSSEEYDRLIGDNGEGIQYLSFQIFGEGFEVSVNNDTFYPLLEDAVFSSGDYLRMGVKSIRISADAKDIQFRFNILS